METITWEEHLERENEKKEQFKQLPLSDKLPYTVDKMINIVRGRTGGSEIYAQMLLSMLPGSSYKVCINYWCYKADSDDFQTMIELMQNSDMLWEYEKLVKPYAEELEEFMDKV